MATEKSTFDPFSLLSPALIHSYGIDVFKGSGTNSTNSFGLETTDQKLYFSHVDSEVPVTLTPASADGFWYLVDGVTGHDADGVDDIEWVETLAIAKREIQSSSPVALINSVAYYHQRSIIDVYDFMLLDDSPYVVFFDDAVSEVGGQAAVKEVSRELITSNNNEYWEGFFQYDINKDGSIPSYVPSEYPLSPTLNKDLNGEMVKGTKKDDILKGTKKDDYINGKKGDDILKGKKGNDVLLGKKGLDRLLGRKGDDHLNGGAGDDLLKGGKGADTFKLSKGFDTILDYNASQGDKIAIPEEFIGSFTISNFEITTLEIAFPPQDNSLGTLISVEGYGQLLLSDVQTSFVEQNNADIFVQYV